MGYQDSIDTNFNYAHHRTLLCRLHNHQNQLFNRYSKLLMLRVDFSYPLGSNSHSNADRNSVVADMVLLLQRCHGITELVGYVWVQEYTERHGMHIHAAFYLNGQKHRKVWRVFETLRDIWKQITNGEGYAFRCAPQDYYQVKGEWVVSHDDVKGRRGMQYILSYLSKTDQKTEKIIYQLSSVPSQVRCGRPRSG
ncbi:MAG: inovirus Gp2 family protein [Enterobacteriaceae bacterium]|nr:inovirus Gp2 family protein [Enterobacteriaceae bacterium]